MNCPFIGAEFYKGSKEFNRAQECVDKFAARLSASPESARAIARAGTVFCSGEIALMVGDVPDFTRAERLKAGLVPHIIDRAEYVAITTRASGCMTNPEFRRRVAS